MQVGLFRPPLGHLFGEVLSRRMRRSQLQRAARALWDLGKQLRRIRYADCTGHRESPSQLLWLLLLTLLSLTLLLLLWLARTLGFDGIAELLLRRMRLVIPSWFARHIGDAVGWRGRRRFRQPRGRKRRHLRVPHRKQHAADSADVPDGGIKVEANLVVETTAPGCKKLSKRPGTANSLLACGVYRRAS